MDYALDPSRKNPLPSKSG